MFWALKRAYNDRRRARRALSELQPSYTGRVLAALLAICAVVFVLLLAISPALGEGEHVYVAIVSGTLNVRDEPGGKVIAYAYPGDEESKLVERKGWTQITCGAEAGKGWVKSEYLSPHPVEFEDLGTFANTSGGRIRVRKTPGGERRRWMEDGETVEVLAWITDAEGVRWAGISDGYVMEDYLEAVFREGEER